MANRKTAVTIPVFIQAEFVGRREKRMFVEALRSNLASLVRYNNGTGSEVYCEVDGIDVTQKTEPERMVLTETKTD